ncbi:MAG: YutD family protein [Pisciglobus halotolerans]|nr:YutD family protein [Pisciglobus halotolerans]
MTTKKTTAENASQSPEKKDVQLHQQQTETEEEQKKVNELAKEIDNELEKTTEITAEKLIERLDQTMLTIDGLKYSIIEDYREAFDSEKLEERYSPILEKYDYIVADWGYDQLRLKGFYKDQNRKVPQEKRIGQLEDYIYEYCNFGAPYFVIERLETPKKKGLQRHKKEKKKKSSNQLTKKQTPSKTTAKEKESFKKPKSKHNNHKVSEKTSRQTGHSKSGNDFVKKEIDPKKEERKKKEESTVVKTVKNKEGTKSFNIRRKDMEKAKNKPN